MEIIISSAPFVGGGIAGFFYWKKIGCLGGSCSTFMGKYSSMLYGGLVAVLLSGIIMESLGVQ